MARWQTPDLAEGPLKDLNRELHALRRTAGDPSARDLCFAVQRVVSHTKIHHAFIKPTLPTWGVVEVVVEQLALRARPRRNPDTEINRIKALWDKAAESPEGLKETSDASSTTSKKVVEFDASNSPAPSTFLSIDDFTGRNALIYRAIIDLHNAGKNISVPRVAAELDRRGQLALCGGEDYLFECVKEAIKGAYEAGVPIQTFAHSAAIRVRKAADARRASLPEHTKFDA